VKVTVRLFAGLRERAGWSEREVEGVTRLGDVWPALDLGGEPEGLLYAVNKEYAGREHELRDGDEVALIPPVSGGAFRLSGDALSLDAAVDEVRSEHAGAIATFVGTTRVESRGRTVQHLDYEAYVPMALEVLTAIADEIEIESPGVRMAIHHRIGTLAVGETAVVVAASAPHRAEAFAACRIGIERLKQRAPIWKKEIGDSGAVWVGIGP